MNEIVDIHERLASLETDTRHIAKAVGELAEEVASLNGLLQQAKGARWLLVMLVSIGSLLGLAGLGRMIDWFTK